MKTNHPPFYIGETVEYITGYNMPKGTKVVVTDIWQQVCGCWYLEFNNNYKIANHLPPNHFWICARCNTISSENICYIGWEVESFRSIIKLPLMTFTQIKEKEKEEILINN